jgi:hypothetical protein
MMIAAVSLGRFRARQIGFAFFAMDDSRRHIAQLLSGPVRRLRREVPRPFSLLWSECDGLENRYQRYRAPVLQETISACSKLQHSLESWAGDAVPTTYRRQKNQES